jgi:hypothetical protein
VFNPVESAGSSLVHRVEPAVLAHSHMLVEVLLGDGIATAPTADEDSLAGSTLVTTLVNHRIAFGTPRAGQVGITH